MTNPYQLILIDDDPILTMIFKKLIDKFEIHQSPVDFRNASLAIDYLMESYDKEPMFVVFLDLNMPIMNGWQFMDKLKGFASPDKVKIFILSSSTNEIDIENSKSNEFVVDYMIKLLMFDSAVNLKEEILQIVNS